jgi:ribosome-associated translation inhibitor RaiA
MLSGARELPRYSGYITNPEIGEILDKFCTIHNCPKSHAVSKLLEFWEAHRDLDSKSGQPLELSDELKDYINERLSTVNLNIDNGTTTVINDVRTEVEELKKKLKVLEGKVDNNKTTVNNLPQKTNSYLATDNSEVEVLEQLPSENKLEGHQNKMDDDSPQEDREKFIEQFSDGLSQTELGKRFGMNGSSISRQKNKPEFKDWSRGKDPQNISWEVRGDRFYPVGS